MASPRPKPSSLKLLAENPGKRKINDREPMPGRSKNEVPSWMPPKAKQYWQDLHPMLERIGVLSEADETALAGLCATYALWRSSFEFLQKHGTTYKTVTTVGDIMWKAYPQVGIESDTSKRLRAWMVEFGLTPSSRTKVKTVNSKKDNKKKLFNF